MKLLFDQNLSFRLINKIADSFPNARQVRALGLENAHDSAIWLYAKDNDFTIVTFDADFLDMAQVKGIPPKIIWLRTGNMTTNAIATILLKYKQTIYEFIKSEEYTSQVCLEIDCGL